MKHGPRFAYLQHCPNCSTFDFVFRSVGGDVDTSKLNRIFTKLDENNDGLIDGREWLAASCNKGIRQFTELLDEFDINGKTIH